MAMAFLSVLALASAHGDPASKARQTLVAAKRTAYESNYRNDQAGLRTAIAAFAASEADPELGYFALYYEGWSEWMLASSQIVAAQPAAATASLESSVGHMKRAAALRPDDAESETVLVFSLVAITSVTPARWKDLAMEIGELRRRAVALAPRNPRVMIMDAMMAFYAPAQYGGGQEKGIARWLEALPLFGAEKFDEALQPDWGRTLAKGWLANLYLSMTPPHNDEARAMADKALSEKPGFWFVETQVMPKVRASAPTRVIPNFTIE